MSSSCHTGDSAADLRGAVVWGIIRTRRLRILFKPCRTSGVLALHLAAQGLDRFTNLVTLSLGSVNLTSLANFPELPKLQSLLLSDNRIAGGLEALTAAKLDQLTELDLSNNKLASLPSLKPLAGLRSLQALHVQANPVENSVKGLRQALFTMIAALQYVDDTDRFGKGVTLLHSQAQSCALLTLAQICAVLQRRLHRKRRTMMMVMSMKMKKCANAATCCYQAARTVVKHLLTSYLLHCYRMMPMSLRMETVKKQMMMQKVLRNRARSDHLQAGCIVC